MTHRLYARASNIEGMYGTVPEFAKIINIGTFRVNFEDTPYTISVNRFFVKPHITMKSDKRIPCYLETYHNKQMGRDMGIIGTTSSMTALNYLKDKLVFNRTDTLLYLPKPTIIINDEDEYKNCEISPGESYTVDFGYGNLIIMNLKTEDQTIIREKHSIPREIGYLPTQNDANNGIYGCIVSGVGNIHDTICDILMGKKLKDGRGFSQIEISESPIIVGDHEFMVYINAILNANLQNLELKNELFQKRQNEIAEAKMNRTEQQKRDNQQRKNEKAAQAEKTSTRGSATPLRKRSKQTSEKSSPKRSKQTSEKISANPIISKKQRELFQQKQDAINEGIERIKRERIEKAMIEKERIKNERIENEKKERIERARIERARIEQEKLGSAKTSKSNTVDIVIKKKGAKNPPTTHTPTNVFKSHPVVSKENIIGTKTKRGGKTRKHAKNIKRRKTNRSRKYKN